MRNGQSLFAPSGPPAPLAPPAPGQPLRQFRADASSARREQAGRLLNDHFTKRGCALACPRVSVCVALVLRCQQGVRPEYPSGSSMLIPLRPRPRNVDWSTGLPSVVSPGGGQRERSRRPRSQKPTHGPRARLLAVRVSAGRRGICAVRCCDQTARAAVTGLPRQRREAPVTPVSDTTK